MTNQQENVPIYTPYGVKLGEVLVRWDPEGNDITIKGKLEPKFESERAVGLLVENWASITIEAINKGEK